MWRHCGRGPPLRSTVQPHFRLRRMSGIATDGWDHPHPSSLPSRERGWEPSPDSTWGLGMTVSRGARGLVFPGDVAVDVVGVGAGLEAGVETLGLSQDAFVAVARVDVDIVVENYELGVDVVE